MSMTVKIKAMTTPKAFVHSKTCASSPSVVAKRHAEDSSTNPITITTVIQPYLSSLLFDLRNWALRFSPIYAVDFAAKYVMTIMRTSINQAHATTYIGKGDTLLKLPR